MVAVGAGVTAAVVGGAVAVGKMSTASAVAGETAGKTGLAGFIAGIFKRRK